MVRLQSPLGVCHRHRSNGRAISAGDWSYPTSNGLRVVHPRRCSARSTPLSIPTIAVAIRSGIASGPALVAAAIRLRVSAANRSPACARSVVSSSAIRRAVETNDIPQPAQSLTLMPLSVPQPAHVHRISSPSTLTARSRPRGVASPAPNSSDSDSRYEVLSSRAGAALVGIGSIVTEIRPAPPGPEAGRCSAVSRQRNP